MDQEEFRLTYQNYEIEVVPEERRFFPEDIKLREFVVIPFVKKDVFMVDTGAWGGNAFPMKVDFETNTCTWDEGFDETKFRPLGTLRKVSTEEPA